MEIIQTRVMRGPNYWSETANNLIIVKLYLDERDFLSGDPVKDLENMLGNSGQGLHNFKLNYTLCRLTAQIAADLQNSAGMSRMWAEVRTTKSNCIFYLVFSYCLEEAGKYAAIAAVRIVNALISATYYNVQEDIDHLKQLKKEKSPDPVIQSVINQAIKRAIPFIQLNKNSMLQIGHGCHQYILDNVSGQPAANKNVILKINGPSNLKIHYACAAGQAENAGAEIINLLYPGHTPSRIPVIAVTGTNGKTTTTRLIAHFARQAGHTTGYTTTDGIYLNDKIITLGDCSGPESALEVLKEPAVNFAVLECARGGILRAGLGFDQCNISIVTNITNDHLGTDGIDTLAELAEVKLVVPKSTCKNGYAILNADDLLVRQMADKLSCKIAWFSLAHDNPLVLNHCQKGNPAAFIADGYFIICHGLQKIKLAAVDLVPLTFGGKSACMIKNVLPAILAAYLSNFSIEQISKGLQSFIPSPKYTPGRMNIFNFDNFHILVDYAHNEDGYKELKKFTAQIQAPVKTGIIAVVGDRSDSDIIGIGKLAAEIFDRIIIRHYLEDQGESGVRINELLMSGLREINHDIPVQRIPDEFEAIDFAIRSAEKEELIFINPENVYDTINHLNIKKQQEINMLCQGH